jgi:hypothetical protein
MEQENFASLPVSHIYGQKPMYIESTPDLLHNVNLLHYAKKESPPSIPVLVPPKEPPDHPKTVISAPVSEIEDTPVRLGTKQSDEQEFLPGKLPVEDPLPHKIALAASKRKPVNQKTSLTPILCTSRTTIQCVKVQTTPPGKSALGITALSIYNRHVGSLEDTSIQL